MHPRLTPFVGRALLLPKLFVRPSSFQSRPAPPKLPADEQIEFERLQRAAAVSSAFQALDGAVNPSPSAPADANLPSKATSEEQVGADADADALQGLMRGAPPEFEGDVNPKTGEVGGPKREPLRWGSQGDWSYNGRVTDF
ncbi:hypothetical protein DCS_05516 [Drechmeria coniospora]|uniref:Succinate dehydrogenase assembly factor 4, mitochondrial n=1 Tax=Drechmeria coniospora TaxID=98403 RepID=A0A151GN33_DRECN|nr:hypothetical protein DCS_05516 [Drechmeria coniospora]KYK58500.1 hypothetical protein DCS_05516 [Drechmeria coniospora]ODA83854.1 hypothetical protein RJ55_02370 [Drechmeria coniospora]